MNGNGNGTDPRRYQRPPLSLEDKVDVLWDYMVANNAMLRTIRALLVGIFSILLVLSPIFAVVAVAQPRH